VICYFAEEGFLARVGNGISGSERVGDMEGFVDLSIGVEKRRAFIMKKKRNLVD